uniref:Tripartite motif-containing protein 45-like n=1 Tax=Crassostrea virginica TaxID=6565 RepID=A0A8B8B5R9_CRAVI|nr:tripartite motif-containing protein 45-like [Crassostrea virginica]
MDPRHSAQDVLRCDLCETPVPPMYCDICHIKLCIPCVGVHLSDRSKEHRVVPFEERGSTTKCPTHPTKICELHCEQCSIPICALCVSSKEHKEHEVVDILESLTTKKEAIQRDLQELEKTIFPEYQTAASNIPALKTDARKHSQKLKKALQKQGEIIHKEIDTIIQKMQSEIDDMSTEHLTVIGKQEVAINHTITEIEQTILDLKKLLNTSDVCHVSKYKSKNEEFRRLPAQYHVTLPTFTPQKINVEQIYQQLGFLSKQFITTEEERRLQELQEEEAWKEYVWEKPQRMDRGMQLAIERMMQQFKS